MASMRAAKTLNWLMLGAMAALGMSVAGAQALNETAGMQWRCLQEEDQDFHILCVPRPIVQDGAGTAPAPDAGSGVDGTASASSSDSNRVDAIPPPSDGPDLRPLALRGAKEVFSARAWRLPLYGKPSNPQEVVKLLEVVLCGGVPRCTVVYLAG
jgi:hypothetical protein